MNENQPAGGSPPRVFISYLHESEAHLSRVLALADRLRRDGVESVLDQHEARPPEGWPAWSERQMQDADFVLAVCTEQYARHIEHDANVEAWSGPIFRPAQYEADGRNRKYLPVIVSGSDRRHVPRLFSDATCRDVSRDEEYEKLFAYLTAVSGVLRLEGTRLPPVPARARRDDFRSTPVASTPPGMKLLARTEPGYDSFLWQEDESVLIRIPATGFTMGSPEGVGNPDEQPAHRVRLDEFYIDKYEVTNEQFARFCRAAGYHTLPEKLGQPDLIWRRFHGAATGDHPVVLVSWPDAVEYCRWAGKRLPTEAERELVARGGDDRKYPWGDEEPDDNRCNLSGRRGGTTAKGSYPAGAAACGALDLTGNVWEWCSDWYQPDYYRQPDINDNPPGPAKGNRRVARGSSWRFGPKSMRSACRHHHDPLGRNPLLGFRCCVSASPCPPVAP